MREQEIYDLIEDVNSIDTDFETRLKLTCLAVRCIKRMGGITDMRNRKTDVK